MANLYPANLTVENTARDTEEQNVTFGKSWKFDHEKGEFVKSPTGKIIQSSREEAWLDWCIKTLRTARYKNLIYSTDHGQEFDELISRQLTREANESEVKRLVAESLLVDERIERVSDFSFAWDKDTLHYSFNVSNVRGETSVLRERMVMRS